MIIYEVSPFREEILKQIDKDFAELKKDPNDIKNRRRIEKHIKDFTGLKRVLFTTKKIGTAHVIPIYNGLIFKSTKFQNLKDIKKLLEEDLKNSKYVNRVIINFNPVFMQKLKPRELTAVLLHEIGHIYQHKSHVYHVLRTIFSKSSGILIFFLPIIPALITILLILRSIDFLEHRNEYNADEFANKYGYGDELVRAFKKTLTPQNKKPVKEIVKDFLLKIFLGTSHPPTRKRMCKLINDSLKKYKDLYPNYSKELILLTKELKCEVKT